jgi:hypothetical protein
MREYREFLEASAFSRRFPKFSPLYKIYRISKHASARRVRAQFPALAGHALLMLDSRIGFESL